MAVTVPTEGPDELVLRVQDLQARLASSGDPATRHVAEELVSAVVQMYGGGLERIVELLHAGGEEGERVAAALGDDPLVATLLLIHDLHPVPLDVRVNQALEHVRPYMESHGGNVELLSLEDGVARIRLEGSCSDCSASAVTLELAIKQALEQSAPDLDGLEVEGVVEQESPAANGGAHPVSIVSAGAAARAPDVGRARPPGRARRGDGRRGRCREPARHRQRRRHTARLSRHLRGVRRRPPRRRAPAGCAALPGVREDVLPAARGPLDGRRTPPARARAAAA